MNHFLIEKLDHSEFAVYSQWRDDDISHDDSDIVDHRNLADSDLMTIAQVRFLHFYRKLGTGYLGCSLLQSLLDFIACNNQRIKEGRQ